MFYKRIFVLLFLILNTPALTQTVQSDQFDFSFDYASFKGQEDYVYLELYFSIFQNNLQYIEFGNQFKAEFTIEISMYAQDSLVLNQSWRNVNYIDSLSDIHSNQKLFSVKYFHIKPGDYQITVKFKDAVSGHLKTKEMNLTLSPYDSENLCMSDIQFASKIQPGTEQNQYYKNSYHVFPNTDRFYGVGLPMLMFYAEIYNLKKPNEPDSTYYSVTYSILDGNEQVVREFPSKTKMKPGNSTVEVGGFNIITFTSGTYFLQFNVEDTTNKSAISKKSKFYIYRPGDFAQIQKQDSLSRVKMKQQATRLIENVYENMTEAEIDNEFGAAAYIANSEEKKIFKTLDLKGKRQFMPQFWANRDEIPDTPRNEYRDDYLLRMRTAEKEFGGLQKGWKKDEGRILLIYGVPDEIERFPSSNENKAYRIWRYFSIQGGVEFIFVDRRGWGEYELVHSNARGELYDENWQRWIDPTQ